MKKKFVLWAMAIALFFCAAFALPLHAADRNSTLSGEKVYAVSDLIKIDRATQTNDSSVKQETNIKDGLKHNSLKQVLAGIVNLQEGRIGEIIGKFSDANSKWVWIVQEGVLSESINASTTMTTEGVLTILDYNKLKNATQLSVARTIIHELVHAFLTLYFHYDQLNASQDFPLTVLEWRAAENPNYNDIQHAQMEVSFLDDIAQALKVYGSSIGLSIDDAIYADMAWGGLDFQNNSSLSEVDKERIQNRLKAEQLNMVFLNIMPVGLKMG
ncbi:MAG: hypothetical protein ICV65_14275 [Flavisolibacter sp.]|nr:hypothetical protein [Flavisolibacter sp.]